MSLHNLKITVVDGGKSEGSGNDSLGGKPGKGGDSGDSPKNSKLYKMLHFNDSVKGKLKQEVTPTTFFAIQAGVNVAMQTARQIVNFYVSDIGRQNGDSNYQATVNRSIEKGTDVLGIVGGALGGAQAGSMFGGVGALVGATIGAMSSGINLGFKYAERERAYQHEMFQENNSQAYNLARANYTALTGRVR